MTSIMEFLIFTSLFLTSAIAAGVPMDTDIASAGMTAIGLYQVNATSENRMFVLNNGTLFDPNPSASPIERVCIGSDTPSCSFGAEDGTWIAVDSITNYGCADISPPLVLNNGFCCLSPDDCALLDQPFTLTRDVYSPTGVTVIEVFSSASEASFPYYITVKNNGHQSSFNPAAVFIDRACMLTQSTMSCGFGAEDGTWIQLYNDTDGGCSDISPPATLNSITCCVDFEDCHALGGPFTLQSRDAAEAAKPKLRIAGSTTALTLISSDNSSQSRTVPSDGTTFSLNTTNSQLSRVCVSIDTTGCVFHAADGTAYAVHTFEGSGCVNVDSNNGLDRGFCCKDFYSCGATNLPSEPRGVEHSSNTLQDRGPVVNNTLAIFFEGSPNLVGWELVVTNLIGFNVTANIDWAVGQICILSNTALCAFVGEDGTDYVVVGGQNSNCTVVGPPQILIDGCCCNSWSQCNAADKEILSRVAGPAVIASITDTDIDESTVAAPNSSVAAREATVDDVTVQYYGAAGAYAFNFVKGDSSIFTTPSWGVDQVCIISPQGFCGFFNSDMTVGFEVGPVASGEAGACYSVGGAYALAYGLCCRSSDGCTS